MLKISHPLRIPESEVRMSAIRAQGPGGQNVNKVSSAIQLHFDIRASSLPQACKQRLLALHDRRISAQGVIVIKAQGSRSQERNRADALERLRALIRRALATRKPRRPTAPTPGARERRLEQKTRRGRTKILRRKTSEYE